MNDIDREVAEKVMGWYAKTLYDTIVGPERYWVADQFSNSGLHLVCSWSPSTRIDHAWEVFERLKQQYTMVSVDYHEIDGWWCTLYPKSEHSIEGDYTETAPLAICRAALAAVEPDTTETDHE